MSDVKNCKHAVKLAEIKRAKLLKKVLWTAFRCMAYFLLVTGALTWMFYFDGRGEGWPWVMLVVASVFVLSDIALYIFTELWNEWEPEDNIFSLIACILLNVLLFALLMAVSVIAFLYQLGKLVVCWIQLKHVAAPQGTRKKETLLLIFMLAVFLISMMSGGLWLAHHYPIYHARKNIAAKAATGITETVVNRKNWAFAKTRTWGIGVVMARNNNTALILTNRYIDYVIEKNEELQKDDDVIVRLANGVEYKARVAALPRQKDVDMALLYVNTDAAVKIGDGQKNKSELSLTALSAISKSGDLKINDDVMSLGYGENNTAWKSDVVRSITDQGKIVNQAHCNLVHNSILFDDKGNIIGINCPPQGTICDAGKLLTGKTLHEHAALPADYILKYSEWDYHMDIKDLLSKIEVK